MGRKKVIMKKVFDTHDKKYGKQIFVRLDLARQDDLKEIIQHYTGEGGVFTTSKAMRKLIDEKINNIRGSDENKKNSR